MVDYASTLRSVQEIWRKLEEDFASELEVERKQAAKPRAEYDFIRALFSHARGDSTYLIDSLRSPRALTRLDREHLAQVLEGVLERKKIRGRLSRLDHKSEGAIIIAMQRLHPDDFVGHMLEQGGWTHLNLPAIAEEESLIALGVNRSHRRMSGDLLHPAALQFGGCEGYGAFCKAVEVSRFIQTLASGPPNLRKIGCHLISPDAQHPRGRLLGGLNRLGDRVSERISTGGRLVGFPRRSIEMRP